MEGSYGKIETRWSDHRASMNEAIKRVEKDKGSHRIDGMKADMPRHFLIEHGNTIVLKILEGRYKPQPVRRVNIPKTDGGKRGHGIPTGVDRVIQQAIAQVMSRVFEPTFSEHSYGFRPNRGSHNALKQAEMYLNEGYKYVIDLDSEKFFDRVYHDIQMSLIAKELEDERLLMLIRSYLSAEVMEHGVIIPKHEGAPQRRPLSPLLSNVMLDGLDKLLESLGHKFCRSLMIVMYMSKAKGQDRGSWQT